jgi:hypothetical protein
MRHVIWRRSASFVVVAVIVAILLAHRSDGTPAVAVSGEIVETFCWAKLQIGGAAHASCGIQCAKRGIPIAVFDKASRKSFVLLPGRDKMSVPPELVAMMGREATITGEIITRGGNNFLLVESWKPARAST